MTITKVSHLRTALQKAIEVEHATIPVYLTACYSIKEGQNSEVSKIISSVAIEEMTHMALACNLLNSIDGHPEINKPKFVPKFPRHLPGGLRPDLIVSLRKCSIDQIKNVFMQIEEPEKIKGSSTIHSNTIGDFYKEIENAFTTLNEKNNIFTGHSSKQVSMTKPDPQNRVFPVTNLETAKKAINKIVTEGEGSSEFNPDDGYSELSHYYKFAEIVHGKKIVIADGSYSYTGDPISLDPTGVYNMIDDPNTESLPENSLARNLSEKFNITYTHILHTLHEVFNGKPKKLTSTIELMFKLPQAAQTLMTTPIPPKNEFMAGTAFQFHTN